MSVMTSIREYGDVEATCEGVIKRIKDMVYVLKKKDFFNKEKGSEDPI
jgi:hypothetical protein